MYYISDNYLTLRPQNVSSFETMKLLTIRTCVCITGLRKFIRFFFDQYFLIYFSYLVIYIIYVYEIVAEFSQVADIVNANSFEMQIDRMLIRQWI